MGKTKIEWTTDVWNPVVGCSLVSPGCTNCYAMKFAGNRLDGNPKAPHYAGTTQKSKVGPVWSGKLALAPESILFAPLRWKRPRMIFVNSMGDLFHEDCPDDWIDQVFAVMALAPQHTFQILTKRAERMREIMTRMLAAVIASEDHREPDEMRAAGMEYVDLVEAFPHLATSISHPSFVIQGWPLPNVWLGVSAEDQPRADERIPHLQATPAAVRFVSAEPLLGPLDLSRYLALHCECHGLEQPRLDWVIVGGESGPNARPMHPYWAVALRDQCEKDGVPFFFKQWGEFQTIVYRTPNDRNRRYVNITPLRGEVLIGGEGTGFPVINMRRVGKAKAGRVLAGREHNGMPEPRP
jgi:protein gp37